jgi:hypothetical protein
MRVIEFINLKVNIIKQSKLTLFSEMFVNAFGCSLSDCDRPPFIIVMDIDELSDWLLAPLVLLTTTFVGDVASKMY